MKDSMRNKIYKYKQFISFIIRNFNFVRNQNQELNIKKKVHKSNIYNFLLIMTEYSSKIFNTRI